MDNSSQKAISILDELRAIIEEQEATISDQQSQITTLQLKVSKLTSSNEALIEKMHTLEKTKSDNSSQYKNHRRRTSSGKRKRNLSSNQQNRSSASAVDEEMPGNLDQSSVERSGSFQRELLEEREKHRTARYELSSDIRDKQVEMIRKLYGGANKAEHAARVIQEAYRSYRMRSSFDRIRKSRTRRITLDYLATSSINRLKEETAMSRSKSVDLSKSEVLEILEDSFSETNQKRFDRAHQRARSISVIDDTDRTDVSDAFVNEDDDKQEEEEEEVEEEEEGEEEQKDEEVSADPEKVSEDDVVTPKAVSPPNANGDIRLLSRDELVSRILSEATASNFGHVRRKKKHGYETVVIPNQQTLTVCKTQDGVSVSEQVVRLRRPVRSQASENQNSDGEIGNSRESPPWVRTSSDMSLTSYENEGETESIRSSDAASITSDVSSIIGDPMYSSYLRRSTISVRSSWSYDVNNDVHRKRLYKIGLNLFNMKPRKGLSFLIEHKFVANSAPAVATFLLNGRGLSRQMIGEYLGDTQKVFNQEVLDSVCELMEFSGLELDEALRAFQAQVRVQGEAQKVERLVEAFSQRYCTCNPKMVDSLQNPDSIFVLAFAIIMLNTDLHSPNMKHEKRMSVHDFIKNLRGVDNGDDLSETLLKNIYNRIKTKELTTMDDHVSQVLQVENSIVGKKPVLAVPHRRLVCFCRMFQVTDPSKAQRHGLHQREVFLFNDMMLITKILQKKKGGTTYTFKQSISLHGLSYLIFESSHFPHGIRLISSLDNKVLINFNAPNETDRKKFVSDVKECIAEVQQMEALRIEGPCRKLHQVWAGRKRRTGHECRLPIGTLTTSSLTSKVAFYDKLGHQLHCSDAAELEKSVSPNDARSNNYLSGDSKKLSVSMQNLNENNFLSLPRNGDERPTSMYDMSLLNQNNNNRHSTPFANSKSLRNGARFSGIGSIFGHSTGKHDKNRDRSKLSNSVSSLTTNGSTPSITLSLQEV